MKETVTTVKPVKETETVTTETPNPVSVETQTTTSVSGGTDAPSVGIKQP